MLVGCQTEHTSSIGAPSAPPPTSPDTFRVAFETTRGNFVVEVARAQSPMGADRFHEMVLKGYFSEVRFFRVVPGFIAQFGMHGDPSVNRVWQRSTLRDEPVVGTNARGTLVYAKTDAPNSRSNQFFINFGDNAMLDAMGFSPFGRVVEGMEVVAGINAQYGEAPDQGQIESEGNAYLAREFPKLDYIKAAKIVAAPAAPR